MGCGCSGGKPADKDRAADGRTFRAAEEPVDPMACRRCLAKHLSKAAIQAEEVLEDPGRHMELAMCVGNIACAEDHAFSLGMRSEMEVLRRIRNTVWTNAEAALRDLWPMAERAAASVVYSEPVKELARAVRPVRTTPSNGSAEPSEKPPEKKDDPGSNG